MKFRVNNIGHRIVQFLFISTLLLGCFEHIYSQTVTFGYTGATQTYTVPPCVTTLTIVVAGADGGGPTGGNGAVVTATINVTPGQIITVNSGGSGNGIAGGYGGGGGGRNANSAANASFGGGGASTVSIGGSPIIIAGGGGGSGGGTTDANGGNGGCATGLSGTSPYGQGGGGATQFSAGPGGPPWISSGNYGSSGSLGQGGLGAIDPCYNNSPGGGGGGGYYGGGGGGSDCFSSAPYGGGGGGGGSSLVPAGAGCNPGTNNGAGYVTITPNVSPITPTFAAIAPICSGAPFPTLPTTSLNGITGAWSPAPNNLATTVYTFTPSGACPGPSATLTVTVNPNVTPTFNQIAPICDGSPLAPLPTTSLNGITGTWSPALNNSATTTYTFTPTPGLCAVPTTMTITVNPNIFPTFDPVAPICEGGVLDPLPTTSLNGITGTWLPALDNTVTTTYTFILTPGQCAFAENLTIIVDPNITPTFDPINPICSGGVLSPLPTTSLNGITGLWSPALNNLATTTYTFTPTPGLCAVSTDLIIVVNPNIQPTFTAVSPICSGEILTPLPTNSLNGITGTWSPSLDNTTTTTYTFTPTSGVCSLTETMTITVNPNIIPTFNLIASICSGAILNPLPTTSTNGISGTWSPAPNNLATTIYTFTPTSIAGACNLSATLGVVVDPNILPTFNAIAPQCAGSSIAALPTTSNNGITGTWSPAINNQATTTYTFTPTPGLCALPTTLTITIIPLETPTFNQVTAICAGQGLTPLPTASLEGITGTWSPALNNSATTTYTFTPDAGICAVTTTMTIVVTPNTTPTFASINAICEGEVLNPLPSTSLNGINGTWSPAPNNTATTNYTFTPTPAAGYCYTQTTLTITVNPNIVAAFTQIAPICLGESLAAFPATSTNGFTGFWSPAPNEFATTTYTFTPTIGQCALSTTMTIDVNPVPAPSFTFVQEEGCAPIQVSFVNTTPGVNFYNWNFGNGSNSAAQDPTITYSADGCYDVSLTATTNQGCSATQSIADLICLTPTPNALFSSSLGELSEDDLTNSFTNESENANWFSWDFGDGSEPLVAYEGSYTFPNLAGGEYTVTLTAMNDIGCMDTYSITYAFKEQLIYFIPNTFTPDGDEYNHWFLPVFTSGFDPMSYNIKIFNRWGELQFESLDPSVGWDGTTIYGKKANEGTYNWVIEFNMKDGSFERKKLAGHVNLLR